QARGPGRAEEERRRVDRPVHRRHHPRPGARAQLAAHPGPGSLLGDHAPLLAEAGGVGREVETAADPPGSVTAARGATGAGAAGAGPGSTQRAGPGTGTWSPELRPALALQRGQRGPAPPARGGLPVPALAGPRIARR